MLSWIMLKRDLFPSISPECSRLIGVAGVAINQVHPLTSRHRTDLPVAIRDLWKSLTSAREDRRSGYLNEPRIRTAYLRYFLPWNLYRLSRLLPGLAITLPETASILDIGSGPLTVPIALWIAFPALRTQKLTIFCLDRLPAIMAEGQAILEKLAALENTPLPWKIVRLKADFNERTFEKLDLITAANVLNEVIEGGQYARYNGGELAKKLTLQMTRQLSDTGQILLVEPGTTAPAALLASLREPLLNQKFNLEAPCPHSLTCPFSGRRGDSWCHFNFSTEGAPPNLTELSEAAGLPKEQASLSFLFARRGLSASPPEIQPKMANATGDWLKIRIISEPFKLPGNLIGRYGCSAKGRVMVRTAGRWHDFKPGAFLDFELPKHSQTDQKSGATIIDLST